MNIHFEDRKNDVEEERPMSKISYSYYTDADAEQVAELMVQNKFWMGKYNPNMTGEHFSDYQKKKGFVFGVVGRHGHKIVSYVAGYKLGSQRVCNANQIVMSGLIIDGKYRTAVFSIAEMFSLLLAKIIERGYRELIAEVKTDNYPSLYMMKKTGFVLLDHIPTVYGEVVLHNYLPAIVHSIKEMKLIQNDVLSQAMQPFKRAKVFQRADFINERLIETKWKTIFNQYIFVIDIVASTVVGMRVIENGFQIYPNFEDARRYSYINQKKSISSSDDLIVNFYQNNHLYESRHYENAAEKEIVIEASDEVDQLEFFVPEEGRYCFFPLKTWKIEEKKVILMKQDKIEMDIVSGYLFFKDHQKKLFMEMWPCMISPYLEGILEANVEKKIHYHIHNKSCLTTFYKDEKFVMYRQYHLLKDNQMEISTSAKIFAGEINPIFHIGLLDLSFVCSVKLQNGKKITYSALDKEGVFSELIFEDFKSDLCDGQIFEKIELRYGSEKYIIETEEEASCVINFNYIGIRFLKQASIGKQINFPRIIIFKDRKDV